MTTATFGSVERGCGRRQAGGLYIVCGLSEGGSPVEHFLVCPPSPLPEHMDVPRRGVALLERDGVWHVVDHVGSDHYPNVADMVEEIRRYGLSRRAQRTLDFSKLTIRSRILLTHSRAIIDNQREYRPPTAQPLQYTCPKDHLTHTDGDGPCLGTCWEDIDGGEPADCDGVDPDRSVRRTMPAFSYYGLTRPEGVVPVYREGIFASFPIRGIEVVRDTLDAANEFRSMSAVSAAQIPVDVVDL